MIGIKSAAARGLLDRAIGRHKHHDGIAGRMTVADPGQYAMYTTRTKDVFTAFS